MKKVAILFCGVLAAMCLSGCWVSHLGDVCFHAGEREYNVNWAGEKEVYEIDGEKFIHETLEVWYWNYPVLDISLFPLSHKGKLKDSDEKVWLKIDYHEDEKNGWNKVTAEVVDEPANLEKAAKSRVSNFRYNDELESYEHFELGKVEFDFLTLRRERDTWGKLVFPLAFPAYILDIPLTVIYTVVADTAILLALPVAGIVKLCD